MRKLRQRLAMVAVLALALQVALTGNPAAAAGTNAAASPAGAWTEYHRDDGHTGFDSTLPQVTAAAAGWVSSALDQQIFASPLVDNGLVYAATLNNSVYALNQSTGAVVWSRNLGAPETTGWSCGNVSPQGILGTPVIDTAAGRIYVAAFLATDAYWVFGLDLASGASVFSYQIPATIGTGFDWRIEQERGALAVHNGYVYVPFGGRYGDCGSYHGWVVGVPTSGVGNPAVYETPSTGSGIWGAGGVVVDDATGNVFASTGNAVSSGCGSVDQNDAVVRLSPALALQDYFMPQDWQANWCVNDEDLGSAGPLLIGPGLMFQSGKWGGGFLLNPASLGGVNGQAFPAANNYTQAEVCFGNHHDATFGSFAYAAPYIYAECEGRGLVALHVDPSGPSFSPCDAACAAPDWHVGGTATFGPPIVAGGAVWAAVNGGGLYAFNAATGSQIYHSAAFGMNRFVTPAEAGGQVFVPSATVIRSFNMVFGNTWTSLGANLSTGPDAASWAAGRLDVFSRGQDNTLWHISSSGGAWSSWESLGGVITSAPAAVSWGANRIDVFAIGQDKALWHRWWSGTSWSGWERLGGVLTSGPDVASWGSGRLDVFALGQDKGLWHIALNASGWSSWQSLGGVLTADPAAVSWGYNRIDVFGRGQDNGLWHKWWNGSAWSGWYSQGGTLGSGPDASSCSAGHLDVFALDGSSALQQEGWGNAGWTGWLNLGGQWTSDPGAVCQRGAGAADVFVRGTDNAIWYARQLAS
jgi:PQQ-like domain